MGGWLKGGGGWCVCVCVGCAEALTVWLNNAHLLSPFLIGRMFLREPSWNYSSKLYSGSKKFRSTCSGNIRPIGR